MTIQKSINIALAGFITILAASFLFLTLSVSAQEGEENEETATTAEVTTTEAESSTPTENDSYSYVAQSGDSYSLMARKAVQTYGIESSTNLSGAQIIFVETNLTKLAESPRLNLGEKVSISRQLVSEWSEKAKSLTDAQQKSWQVYANKANFNTNAVGEARE
jgi:hypothetical protein